MSACKAQAICVSGVPQVKTLLWEVLHDQHKPLESQSGVCTAGSVSCGLLAWPPGKQDVI